MSYIVVVAVTVKVVKVLPIRTLALYKSFTYLLTYSLARDSCRMGKGDTW